MSKVIQFSDYQKSSPNMSTIASKRDDVWYGYDKIETKCKKHTMRLIRNFSDKASHELGRDITDAEIDYHTFNITEKMNDILQEVNLLPNDDEALQPGVAIALFKQKVRDYGYQKELESKIDELS